MIKLGQNVDNEIGFVAICKMCASIGGNAQLMFLTFSFLLSYLLKSHAFLLSIGYDDAVHGAVAAFPEPVFGVLAVFADVFLCPGC